MEYLYSKSRNTEAVFRHACRENQLSKRASQRPRQADAALGKHAALNEIVLGGRCDTKKCQLCVTHSLSSALLITTGVPSGCKRDGQEKATWPHPQIGYWLQSCHSGGKDPIKD